jgi:plasmid stabilization system protein ParE
MDSYRVVVTASANQELEKIAEFIAQDKPQSSKRFVKELVKAFINSLSNSPEIGTVYQGDIRKLTYKKYTAFYRVNNFKKRVEILHIVNLIKPLSTRNIEF